MASHYFAHQMQLQNVTGIGSAEFAAAFPGVVGLVDGMWSMVGTNKYGTRMPVDRCIQYKAKASRHRCDNRCRDAVGATCECICNGANHGARAFLCE